ncbi:hypothetical protein [Neorhodopirellula lusitana]|uniref:hypothetical protein n=1 Tax=Neorhodopirellula lusitana TaxID=445327 RepID=UPI00384D879C
MPSFDGFLRDVSDLGVLCGKYFQHRQSSSTNAGGPDIDRVEVEPHSLFCIDVGIVFALTSASSAWLGMRLFVEG